MKVFLRVFLAVVIAINSVVGGSLALVACESEHGVHIEFSNHKCCSHSHSDHSSDTFEAHEHCTDVVLAGFTDKEFSDTCQQIKLQEPALTEQSFVYQPSFAENNFNKFLYIGVHIKSPPVLSLSANIPLLI